MSTLTEREIERAAELCDHVATELRGHRFSFADGADVPDGLRDRLAAAVLELCNVTGEVCATSERIAWQDETLETCLVGAGVEDE